MTAMYVNNLYDFDCLLVWAWVVWGGLPAWKSLWKDEFQFIVDIGLDFRAQFGFLRSRVSSAAWSGLSPTFGPSHRRQSQTHTVPTPVPP